MTRQNIFEILKSKYNIPNEMIKITNLFNSKLCYETDYYGTKYYTIEDVVDGCCIHNWKQRGSCLNCEELKYSIGLPTEYNKKTSIDDIVKSLEYYLNILNLFINKKPSHIHTVKQCITIFENIHILLEYINYKIEHIKTEEMILLIPNNPETIAVAEISTENTALAILKYHHSSLKGNLEEKGKLLYQISLEYEPLLKTPIEGYNDFFEKTNALLNNLHIRHNNKTKENNKNKVININDQELEKWYDELYQLLLFCILIKENIDRKDKVGEFLKTIKNK